MRADRSPEPDRSYSLIAINSTPPAHGLAVIDASGTPDDPSDDRIRYIPDEGFIGTDVLQYVVTDGSIRDSYASASVTVTVLPADGSTPPAVQGTSAADRIVLLPRPGNRVAAYLNGRFVGVFGAAAGIVVDGGDGNDNIRAGRLTVPVTIDGGAGDDGIIGGSGHDILTGGAGDDRLFGGPGRDVLVGGTGADRLSGGGGDDVLVAGAAADATRLDEVLTLWTGSGFYGDRIDRITSATTGRLLGAGSTSDDAAADVLAGQWGSDLFFAAVAAGGTSPTDQLSGRRVGEDVIPS
jgi:Ca2+-binding RTX toxin-like protein